MLGATHAHTNASPGSDVTDVVSDVTVRRCLPSKAAAFGSTGGDQASFPNLTAGGSGGAVARRRRRCDAAPRPSTPAGQTPAAYHYGGVSSRLVLVALVLGLIGVRLIRRYMARLLSTGSGL